MTRITVQDDPPDTVPPEKAAPHHGTGHRQRLRKRFIRSGPAACEDYELVEMLLFAVIPRRDVKPLAKKLLSSFGGLSGFLAAPVEALCRIEGISENTAAHIRLVHTLAQRILLNEIMGKPVLGSWQQLIDYCTVCMAQEQKEQLRILYLNRKNQLIADEVLQTGTVDHAPVYPREIVKRALELGATAMILVHNHPSGDPTPSDSDVAITQEVIRAAAALELVVHDHLIISANGYSSFKALGLLDL